MHKDHWKGLGKTTHPLKTIKIYKDRCILMGFESSFLYYSCISNRSIDHHPLPRCIKDLLISWIHQITCSYVPLRPENDHHLTRMYDKNRDFDCKIQNVIIYTSEAIDDWEAPLPEQAWIGPRSPAIWVEDGFWCGEFIWLRRFYLWFDHSLVV